MLERRIPDDDEEIGYSTEHEDEGDVPVDLDAVDKQQGLSVVDVACKALLGMGARPAQSRFHRGVAFETEPEGDGVLVEERRVCRLRGFSRDEEMAVFERLRRPRR